MLRIAALLCVVAACGDKPEPSARQGNAEQGSDVVYERRVSVSQLTKPWLPSTDAVDVQSAGPVKFEHVKITPVAEGKAGGIKPVSGVFSVQFTPVVADAKAVEKIQTRALCRLGERTHAIVDVRGPYKPEGKEISATINVQPYTESPTVCQLDWFGAAPGEKNPTTLLATACFRRDTRDIVSGPCPKESLPPASATTFELVPDTLKLETGTFSYNAVLTAGADVAEKQTWRTNVRCDDGEALRESYEESDTLSAETLLLPPGASMFVVQGVFFKTNGAAAAQCELDVMTGAGKAGKVLATFCVGDAALTGKLMTGSCPMPLRTK